MAPNVLLTDTSRWASSARVAIGLSKRGCKVFGLCPNHHPLLKTRAVKRTFHYSSLNQLQSLIDAIKQSEAHLILPCDDRTTQHLHELYDEARLQGGSEANLAALIERSLGSPASHNIVDSREEVIRVAHEEGIRVPYTSAIHTFDDLEAWEAERTYPWILKAAGTWSGRGVKIAHSLPQAKQVFTALTGLFGTGRVFKRSIVNRDPFCLRPWWQRSRPAVIVQSYIQGRPANRAVACWEGKVLAGISVEVVSAMGPTEPASIVRVIDNHEMSDAAVRLVRRLGLSGFIGLDFMIENSSQAAYLIELNPRCTPPCHIPMGKGRDMIGALCAELSGESLREMPPATENDLIAYFPQAWESEGPLLDSSFQDIPQGEPELLEELRQPWPNRSLLFRAFTYLDQAIKKRQRPENYAAAKVAFLRAGSKESLRK